MTGAERRHQLIDIARSLFAERGYEGTSIEEIAQRANVSKPVVYEHFGGKEGLYAVVVDREMSALLDRITSSLTKMTNNRSRLRIERVALALLTYVDERTDGFRILIRDSPAAITSGSTYSTLLNEAVNQVSSILAGDFSRRGLDAEMAPLYAQALVGSVSMTAQWWLDVREPKKEVVAAHLVNLCWNGLMHLENDPPLLDDLFDSAQIARQQVGDRLPAHDFSRTSTGDRDHRRAADEVVVRRHAVVIGTRARHGEQVPGMQVGGQLDVAGDFVARLAMPSRHGHRPCRCERVPVGQRHTVFRAIQADSRIVAHATVHCDERASAGLRFHRHHPVQRDAGARRDGPARLDHDPRTGETFRGARRVDASSMTSANSASCSSGSPAIYGIRVRRRYSARRESRRRRYEFGHRGDHPADRLAVQRCIDDLRSDMAVQPDQVK